MPVQISMDAMDFRRRIQLAAIFSTYFVTIMIFITEPGMFSKLVLPFWTYYIYKFVIIIMLLIGMQGIFTNNKLRLYVAFLGSMTNLIIFTTLGVVEEFSLATIAVTASLQSLQTIMVGLFIWFGPSPPIYDFNVELGNLHEDIEEPLPVYIPSEPPKYVG